MSRTNKNNIVLGALCGIILLMVVGYAAFSTTLTINGTSAITSNWNVKITNITSKDIVGGATNASTPSYTDLTATFAVNLVSPGDSITYDVTVTNAGTIDAELDKITVSDSNNPAIIFSTSGLSEGSILQAGNSEVLTVTVTYSSGVASQPNINTSSLTVTLDYVQPGTGSGGAVVMGPGGTLKVAGISNSLWFGAAITRNTIKTITLKTDMDLPDNVVSTYDIGVEPGTVTLWIDSANNAIIGADGMILANENSSRLFSDFSILTLINGLENLDTKNITDMSSMFWQTGKITSLDLSSWDTSNVTNMSGLFSQSASLISINLSGWDTSNVTNMASMFQGNTNLTSLDLSSFDTSEVTFMNAMFGAVKSISNLDLSNFDTSNVTNMNNMLSEMISLTSLDFRNATFVSVNSSTNMFNATKTSATIYTKDSTTQTWLNTQYPSGNYIIP